MSHIAQIKLEVRDLTALKLAAESLGLQFNENKRSFKWFGRSVGDYALPTGFTANDLGKCEHTLSVPNNPNAYEIGIVQRRDGQPG